MQIAISIIADCQTKGTLFIIGGGNRDRDLMLQYMQLAGGSSSKIVFFSMASDSPASSIKALTREFTNLGAASVLGLNITRQQADADSIVALLDGATGIYFSGGDQRRHTIALKGSRVEQRLHQLYQGGAIIGGTSAGAAVMSAVMITGDEIINKDTINMFPYIRKGNVETIDGLGFVDDIIVDQHFIRRKRLNRLISVILEHPKLVGVGIDEATAIIVRPDHTFDIVGESSVIVIDATKAKHIHENPQGYLAAEGITFHVLVHGDRYDISKRVVISQKGTR
jgi:cyanophycinase